VPLPALVLDIGFFSTALTKHFVFLWKKKRKRRFYLVPAHNPNESVLPKEQPIFQKKIEN